MNICDINKNKFKKLINLEQFHVFDPEKTNHYSVINVITIEFHHDYMLVNINNIF